MEDQGERPIKVPSEAGTKYRAGGACATSALGKGGGQGGETQEEIT